jgi:endonuclease YncB( thermonuclease family)
MTPALILAAALSAAPAPRPCIGEIARVVDADTLVVACPDGPLRLRLRDVDAPEMTGPCAALGRAVADLVRVHFGPWEGATGLTVAVRADYRDRHGRTVGDATILEGVWRGWPLTDAIIAAGAAGGVETLRPWPHDATGRARAPQPWRCR